MGFANSPPACPGKDNSLSSSLQTSGAPKVLETSLSSAARRYVFGLLPSKAVRLRVARGAFWLLIGACAARIASVATSIVVARSLGVTEFGAFGIIQNTTALFATMAGMGLGLTATKYVAEYRETDPAKAGEIIFFATRIAIVSGAAMMLLLLLGAPLLARYALAAPQLSGALRISAATLLFTAASGAQLGILAGLEAFKMVGILSCVSNLILLLTTVGGVVWCGLSGAISGAVIGAALAVFINHRAVLAAMRKNCIVASGRNFHSQLSIIRNFSVPAITGGLMTSCVNWICVAILVNTAGYREMGIFNSSNYWRQAILFIPATIGYSLLPVLSSLNAQREHEGLKRLVLIGVVVNIGLAMIVGLPVVLFSKTIMRAYGTGFEGGTRVLFVIALAGGVIAVNNHLSRVAAAIGRMWLSLRFDLCWSVASLICSVVLIPKYGSLGLALTALCAALIQCSYQMASLASMGFSLQRLRAPEEFVVGIGGSK